jgi:hypothetical protein
MSDFEPHHITADGDCHSCLGHVTTSYCPWCGNPTHAVKWGLHLLRICAICSPDHLENMSNAAKRARQY